MDGGINGTALTRYSKKQRSFNLAKGKKMFSRYLIGGISIGIMLMSALSPQVFAVPLPSAVTDADYYDNGTPNANKVVLGQMLFFDKIMSGNKNISCATCHAPFMGSGDGLSLPVGEGGKFLGPMRTTGEGTSAIKGRVGRHTPALFNLGAKEFLRLNWQGRHQQLATRLDLPSFQFTPVGIANVLAGQALFPITSNIEMLGDVAENEIMDAVARSKLRAPQVFVVTWEGYMARLRSIPKYVDMFKAAFPEVTSASKMTIVQYANAISAFQATAFRADNSPFDRFLRGESDAMSVAQQRGMDLFYGGANCSSCHSGKFQTDHEFHSIAMPQFGPGFVSSTTTQQEDVGRREMVADDLFKYKFRTPSLRNIALSAPYGHTGAYKTLEGIVRHHLDPANSFLNWNRTQVIMPSRSDLDSSDFFIMNNATTSTVILNANELSPSSLTDDEIKDIIEFLNALTDPASLDQRHLIPVAVPSGLPVGD